MKRKIFLTVTGLLLAAAVWLLIENRPRSRWAVYQGKTARQWLGEVWTTNQPNALAAFREMGTNAFPVLIHELKKNDSSWGGMNRWVYPRLPAALKSHWNRPVDQETIWAAASLVLLNNRQKHDIFPELVRILENKNYRSRSHIYSMTIGLAGPGDKKCVPELTALLRDNDLDTRTTAAVLLGAIDHQTNIAVAALKEALNAKGPSFTKGTAPYYLYGIHPFDESLIPAFMADLQGTNPGIQLNAAGILERYGPAAAAAVPVLTNLLTSQYSQLRQQALQALKKIDPETAAKYETNATGRP